MRLMGFPAVSTPGVTTHGTGPAGPVVLEMEGHAGGAPGEPAEAVAGGEHDVPLDQVAGAADVTGGGPVGDEPGRLGVEAVGGGRDVAVSVGDGPRIPLDRLTGDG